MSGRCCLETAQQRDGRIPFTSHALRMDRLNLHLDQVASRQYDYVFLRPDTRPLLKQDPLKRVLSAGRGAWKRLSREILNHYTK